MKKYIVLEDFTAGVTRFDRPNPNTQNIKKLFKKGDIIEVTEGMDFGLNKFLQTRSMVDGRTYDFVVPKDKVRLASAIEVIAKEIPIMNDWDYNESEKRKREERKKESEKLKQDAIEQSKNKSKKGRIFQYVGIAVIGLIVLKVANVI